MLQFYIFGGIVWFAIMVFVILAVFMFVCGKLAWTFVVDGELSLPKVLEKYWEDECFGEGSWFAGHAFFWILISSLIAMVWPIATLICTVWASLHLLRFLFRVKKKLGKLTGIAHGHPDSVEKTAYDN